MARSVGASPVPRDGKLTAFLVCMWVVMLMATFGGELRLLIRGGLHYWALLLALAFYTACFLTRTWLIDRAVFKPTVRRDKRTIPVRLAPAIADVGAYVQARARELGVDDTIHVYYIPGTWTSVDAYVFGAASHQMVVVSGGLQALFGSPSPQARARFAFVIDHELGHIAHRDTDGLYLARATLYVGLATLLLKAVFVAIVGQDAVLEAYASVFPGAIEPMMFLGSMALSHEPGTAFVIGFFVLFTLFCLMLSGYFYVLIVRRREEQADRFAVANSPDRPQAVDAMRALLAGPALATAAPHAFLGSLRWHPPADQRLDSVGMFELAAIPDKIGTVMIILVLLSVRFLLGDIVNRPEADIPAGMIMASAAYILLIGAVIDLMLTDGVARSAVQEAGHLSMGTLRLAGWTTLVSVALASAAYVFVAPPSYSDNTLEGLQFLIDIETTERTLLILSTPVVVTVFGASTTLLAHWRRGATTLQRVGLNFARSTLAVVLLFLAGLPASRALDSYRLRKFDQYWEVRALAVTTGKTSLERRIDELRKGSMAEYFPKSDSTSPFGPRDIRDQLRDFPMEAQVYAAYMHHGFAPPFSLLALWHAPYRSTFF
jgi:Zn-dependent protease with chaperone function